MSAALQQMSTVQRRIVAVTSAVVYCVVVGGGGAQLLGPILWTTLPSPWLAVPVTLAYSFGMGWIFRPVYERIRG